jgi:Hint domain
MTTLDVTLSAMLQDSSNLGQAGVWAYAAVTSGNDIVQWDTLVNNGTIENNGTDAIVLPGSYVGGKVYFFIQSDTADTPSLPSVITSQSQINFNSASLYDFRFDSFEVTLHGSVGATNDAGNLTAVNGFGLPMELAVPYDNHTTATVGYNISGGSLVSDLAAINSGVTQTYTAGPLAGEFRMAASPAEAVGQGGTNQPFVASDWDGYVTSLEGTAAADVELSGLFNGAPDANNVWHNGGYFAYQLQWDAADSVFWLAPLPSSQIQGYIKLTPSDLENSIYSTLGTMGIYTSETASTPYVVENTGWNDQWGNTLKSLLVGFTGGFFNQQGDASKLNPQNTATIDLNTNINWDPSYAFGNDNITPAPTAYQTSDPYAKIFFDDTNVYGAGYSDALTSGYSVGGPLVPVSEPDTGVNVPNIDLTMFADGETPSGYTTPQVDNVIAAPGGTYAVPGTASVGGAQNVVFDFDAALATNAGVVLNGTSAVTLRILTSDAGGTPVWDSVTIDGSSPAAGSLGLWQIWNLGYDGGTGTYTATPNNSAPKPAGTLLLDNFPTAPSGVSWYQLVVGDKTFNLYTNTTTTSTSNGFGWFVNPQYPGQQGSLAVDGLATILSGDTTDPAVVTFTVAMAGGKGVTYDPSLAVLNTSTGAINTLAPAFAPVVGTINSGTFVAVAGQINPNTNTVTANGANLAFGWTGDNPNAYNAITPASQWVAAITNKIDPLTVAEVTIALPGTTAGTRGSVVAITTGTADLDGIWQTGTIQLNNGTYDVRVQEFQPSDTTFTTPLTPLSQELLLTVTCFAQGTPIMTEAGAVPVERLTVGTRVPTCTGRGAARVIWIGHRTIDCRRHPRPEAVTPIRISRNAFGTSPTTDILLSPDHSVFIDDVLVPVRYLVNGTSIRREPARTVTYYHVELERHDVMLAAGLPIESFLDTGGRSAFINEPVTQMHPDFSSLVWEADACAPLVVSGPQLERLRRSPLNMATAVTRQVHVPSSAKSPALPRLTGTGRSPSSNRRACRQP